MIAGLTNGLAAEDMQRQYGLSAVEYDSLRRALLHHGLAWVLP